MFWIVITLVLLPTAALLFKLRLGMQPKEKLDRRGEVVTTGEYGLGRVGFPVATIPLLGLWALITIMCSVNTIQAGHIGLVRTFGSYTGQQRAGLNFKAPYQSVDEVSGRILKRTVDMSGGDKGSAVSSETQPVFAKVEINYQLELGEARHLYSEVGAGYYGRIIEPRVQQAFKAESVKYKTIEIAPNREKIRAEVAERLNEQLDDYGIKVISLTIRDLDFGQKFMDAIEDKQAATEQAKAAEARVATAKAEADSAREKARGEADAISLKGKALRENPQSIEQLAIEKLNPNVQVIYLPAGTSPSMFLNAPAK